MVDVLLEKHVVVTLTLMVNEIVYNADRFDVLVPQQDYYHPATDASARGNYAAIAAAWSEQDFTGARAVWPKVLRFAKLLYDSSVRARHRRRRAGGPIEIRLRSVFGMEWTERRD